MIRAVSKNHTCPCFALKCDIRKFFDSVDHATLITILGKKIKDEKVFQLLIKIIESFEICRSNLFDRRGIPIGNLTSQIFANIYMNEFDQFMKHDLKVKNYARYTDDFVIVSGNREYLESLLSPIKDFLKLRLHLDLHPNKVTLRKHIQGIDFLGYVILPYHIRLRTKTKRKIPKKIRQSVNFYKGGYISEVSMKSSLASYLGVLSHADTFEMSKNVRNMFWFWLNE
jgi:hypothetical protein